MKSRGCKGSTVVWKQMWKQFLKCFTKDLLQIISSYEVIFQLKQTKFFALASHWHSPFVWASLMAQNMELPLSLLIQSIIVSKIRAAKGITLERK